LPTTALAVSPNYAQDHTVFAAVEGNVLRSADGGDTWAYAELGQPVPLVSVLAIAPDFDSKDLLLAGTLDDGIMRSTNRGRTWQRWNFGLLDAHINALTFAPDGSILAGTESGVFRSTNDGRAWREVDFPMDLAPVISLGSAGDAIFAGTEENGLHRSIDGGHTWTKLAPDLLQGAVIQIFADRSGLLAVLEDGIYFSADQGESWDGRGDADFNTVISSLVAPHGLDPEYPLWVGLSDGEIIKV
jgi:photosystem II stability/assembly factor-like uncharacterized protein